MPTCSPSNCSSFVFVGRERELSDLAGALERAIAGTGGLIALLGEPGIGKSRLAAEIGSEAQRRHTNVLWGYCLGSYGDCDFSPWIQIMRDCLRWLGSAKAELSQASALSSLIPRVAELTDKFSAFRGRTDPELESGLYETIAALLRSVSESQPLLLILDDLHAADRPSLSLLPRLARELRDLRILIVITCRDGELRRVPELADTLAAPTLRDLQRIRLRGLDTNEIGELLRVITGKIPEDGVVECVSRITGGNPLFVELLASNHLLSGCGNRLPEELRVSAEQHLGPVSQRTRNLLQGAAVIGQEFQLPILLSASDLVAEELLDSLSEAEQLGLIEERTSAPGSYCFSHPLVREALYHQIAGAKRAKLHGRVGELLEELYSDDSSSLASIAGHFFEAAGVGYMTKAIAYCQCAAEHAASLREFEQSIQLYGMALRAADLQRPIDEKKRCELLLELAMIQQGDVRASWKSLKWAAAIARRISDPELMARTGFNLTGPDSASVLSGQEAESAISMLHRQQCVSAVDSANISQMPSSAHPSLELWVRAPDIARSDELTRVLSYGSGSHVRYKTEFSGLFASPESKGVDPHRDSSVAVADEEYIFRKEGDYWTIVFEQKVLRLMHLKGLSYIAHLLRHPGQEFHALQLREIVTGQVALEETAAAHSKRDRLRQNSSVDNTAAPLVDAPARAAYKQRLRELHEELEESKSFNDIGRTSRTETEIQFISNELLRAEGLGGRSRTWPSESKRARVSVANAIRTALNKVRREHPSAGRFFATTIRTGYFCSFLPDPRFPKSWNF